LEYLWTTDSDERMSLRDLADYFNQQLLKEAMAKSEMQPLSGEVKNIYRLLTADDVGDADNTRARRRLEREGIDVEELERDFLTYQAIRTYLKDHRGAEYPKDSRPRKEVEAENLQRIRGRTVTVTNQKIKQLKKGGHITLGGHRIFVDINVLCEDCGSQYAINDLLTRGGCECEQGPVSEE
jgi:hypothetical protein